MKTVDCSMWQPGSQAAGLNAYLAKLLPGEYVELTANVGQWWLENQINLTAVPGLTLDFKASFNFAGSKSHGAVVSQPGIRAIGKLYFNTFQNCGLSGWMITTGADEFEGINLDVCGYNSINTTVQAAFFILPTKGTRLSNLDFTRCCSSDGFGNSFRFGACEGVRMINCGGAATKVGPSQSADIMTVNASDFECENLYAENAAASSILIWPDHDLFNITFRNTTIVDGAQAGAGNAAVEVNPQGYKVNGLRFLNTDAHDDQTTPTMGNLFVCNGTGTINDLQMLGYSQNGLKYGQDPAKCFNQVTVNRAVFDPVWR